MKRSDAFPSKYLKKEDVTNPLIATIRHVEMGDVGMEENSDTKPIMFFREADIKPMVINSGNWDTIAELYGDDSDGWSMKQIEIYIDPNVKFSGKKVGGLRVRQPGGSNNAPAPVAATDPVTAFWQFVNATKYDREEAKKLITENAGDFVAALKILQG